MDPVDPEHCFVVIIGNFRADLFPLSGHFLRTLFLCAGFPGVLPFLSHTLFEQPLTCTIVSLLQFTVKSCGSLTLKSCVICVFCIGLIYGFTA